MTVGYGIGFSHLELFLLGSTFSTSSVKGPPCPPMTNNFHVSVTIELVDSMVAIDVVEMVVSMVVAVLDFRNWHLKICSV